MCNLPFFCYGNLKFTLQGIPVNDRNVDNLGYEPKVAVQNNLISLSGSCLKLWRVFQVRSCDMEC